MNFPSNVPINVTATSAKDAPINTGMAELLFASKLIVASCVLSPNSAINTSENV